MVSVPSELLAAALAQAASLMSEGEVGRLRWKGFPDVEGTETFFEVVKVQEDQLGVCGKVNALAADLKGNKVSPSILGNRVARARNAIRGISYLGPELSKIASSEARVSKGSLLMKLSGPMLPLRRPERSKSLLFLSMRMLLLRFRREKACFNDLPIACFPDFVEDGRS